MPASGIVVLDNNCFDALTDPASLERFRANLRAADWIAQPSEVNLLEVVATANDRRQRQLLEILSALAEGEYLLRWPFAMLKELGQAIAAGKDLHRVSMVHVGAYLTDREEARRIRTEANQFNQNIETAFIKLHDRNRSKMRKGMRDRGITDVFGSAGEFIRSQWQGSEMRSIFADVTWKHFGLPGKPPMEVLDICEPWRLMLDAEGVAVYERAVAAQQPRRVQRMDLIQLVYMGLAPRRMLVTADKGLFRAAEAVLTGRYRNARVIKISEMI